MMRALFWIFMMFRIWYTDFQNPQEVKGINLIKITLYQAWIKTLSCDMYWLFAMDFAKFVDILTEESSVSPESLIQIRQTTKYC